MKKIILVFGNVLKAYLINAISGNKLTVDYTENLKLKLRVIENKRIQWNSRIVNNDDTTECSCLYGMIITIYYW